MKTYGITITGVIEASSIHEAMLIASTIRGEATRTAVKFRGKTKQLYFPEFSYTAEVVFGEKKTLPKVSSEDKQPADLKPGFVVVNTLSGEVVTSLEQEYKGPGKVVEVNSVNQLKEKE